MHYERYETLIQYGGKVQNLHPWIYNFLFATFDRYFKDLSTFHSMQFFVSFLHLLWPSQYIDMVWNGNLLFQFAGYLLTGNIANKKVVFQRKVTQVQNIKCTKFTLHMFINMEKYLILVGKASELSNIYKTCI